MGTLINTDNSGAERKWGSVKDLEPHGGGFPSSGNTMAAPAGWWESSLRADQPWSWAEAGVTWCCHEQNGEEVGGHRQVGRWVADSGGALGKVIRESWCMETGKARASFGRSKAGTTLFTHVKWKWKSLSRMQLFATPWTLQSMEFFRPEHWSG